MLEQWLSEEFPDGTSPFDDVSDWDITMKDIQHAIRKAPSTMPGPDGIPYLAWKRLSWLGATILHQVSQAMGKEGAKEALHKSGDTDSQDQHSFNLGNMVFLPKSGGGGSHTW